MKSNPLLTHDEQTRRDNAQTPVRFPKAVFALGGLSIVRFSYSATNGIASAICEIKSRPVGASVPDTILEGSAIIVHDPSGCYFNAPGEELTGRHGWAAYMRGDLMPDQLYEAPHWEVFAMCCDDSECYE